MIKFGRQTTAKHMLQLNSDQCSFLHKQMYWRGARVSQGTFCCLYFPGVSLKYNDSDYILPEHIWYFYKSSICGLVVDLRIYHNINFHC